MKSLVFHSSTNLSQSQSHIATDGQSISKSWRRAPCGAHDQIFITLRQLWSSSCGAPSLPRGRVCLLCMLLVLASVVFPRSESLGTRDYILLSFRRLLRLAGSRWRYSTPPPHGWIQSSQSQSYVTTDDQPASLSWCQAPIWGLRPEYYFCRTVAGLLLWGALSDERTDLPFSIAAGPRQRSYSRGRVPWDSRPYFTVNVKVKVMLRPTVQSGSLSWNKSNLVKVKVKVMLRPTVQSPVCLGIKHSSGT
jgi:hypothetical protein